MSTEATFYEDNENDIFMNKCLLTGEITIYKDYGMPDAIELEITSEMIKALLEQTAKDAQ